MNDDGNKNKTCVGYQQETVQTFKNLLYKNNKNTGRNFQSAFFLKVCNNLGVQ